MSRSSTLLLVLSSALALCAVPARAGDEDIVRAFFPQALIADYQQYLEPGDEVPIRYDFDRADLDGSGKADYIVAAYSNSSIGMVRVLRPQGNGATVVAETNEPTMSGFYASLRLLDLDGDAKPEIVAAFGTNGGHSTWIFQWANNALQRYGPVSVSDSGVVNSALGTAEFRDLDGDGRMEIVETQGRWAPDDKVFKRQPDGQYGELATRLLYHNRFVRGKGDPEIFTGVFATTPGRPLTITLTNGDLRGENAVTAGDLYFNGKLLIAPRDFQKKTRTFTFTVVAEEENEVEVGLEGKPGTEVTVAVSPQP